jgi:F420-non-reducing hydrogenase iron-sulfur subunit
MFGARRAAENYDKTEKMVNVLGLEKERMRLEWISAAESTKFASVVNEMVEQVRSLGPSPLKNSKDKLKE